MRYAVDKSWPGRLPYAAPVDVVAIEIDAEDNVWLFNRGAQPLLVYDRRGSLLESWGAGIFAEPHGLHRTPEGALYCVDYGDHTVRAFAPDRSLRMMLGTPGQKSDTGARGRNWTSIQRAAGPFNAPTDLAIGPDGDIYVSDGYANSRIHRFAPDGTLRTSWGVPGTGPGEFQLPHSIELAADGLLHVSDRENNRIQRFSLDGAFVGELGGINRPNTVHRTADGLSYVAELGYRTEIARTRPAPPGRPHSRIVIFDGDDQRVLEIGGEDPRAPGSFAAAHCIGVDSEGALYVGDAAWSANPTDPQRDVRPVQKFIRER